MTSGPTVPRAPVPALPPPRDAYVGTAAPTASWLARVVATLLDEAVLLAAAFLLSPAVPVEIGDSLPGTVILDPAHRTPAFLAVVVIGVLMQAYLGATPGKLVMGIAVVRDGDARPIGLLRTLGRWVAHLLDALLFIGYLRPLWHHERRTFADSIAGTLVLATRAPLRHAGFERDRNAVGPPLVWTEARPPRWRRHLTTAAAAVCTVGVLYGCGPTGAQTVSGDEVMVSRCTDPSGGGLVEASLVLTGSGTTHVTRLGVTREAEPTPGTLEARWDTRADAPDVGEVNLSMESPDRSTVYEQTVPPEGIELGELGADPWSGSSTWHVVVRDLSGELIGACGGVLPDPWPSGPPT